MRRRVRWVAMNVVLCLGTLGARPALAQTPGQLPVNLASSAVGFTVYAKKLFTMKQEGRFTNFEGDVRYDPNDPVATRMDLTVYTASVDMKNPERDALLRSSDFFDVDRFPTMHFSSAGAVEQAGGGLLMTGDLTIRGITRRMSVPVRVLPAAANANAAVAPQLETTFEIDRTEFGLTGSPRVGGFNVSIAKNVKIHIAIGVMTLAPRFNP